MTRQLVWDPAPGDVRCAVLEGGGVVELHLIPLCQASPSAEAGARLSGRLVSRLGQAQALIALETGEEALLRPVPSVAEGARLMVDIVRSRVPEPGRWKRALARPAGDDAPAPDRITRLLASVDAVICASAAAADSLPSGAPNVRIDAAAVDDVDFDTLLDQARTGLIAFDGGDLSIERTRAMTVIDVDGTCAPLDLNRAAARAIGRALRLFDITGPIGIDFVSMASRADRQAVDHTLAQACAPLGPHERTSVNGYGFCQIIRPRTGPSLPEQVCGITPGRLSDDAIARALLRQAAQSQGIGPRTITAQAPIIDLLRHWPEALAQTRRIVGADVMLVCDSAISRYGLVHVSPA